MMTEVVYDDRRHLTTLEISVYRSALLIYNQSVLHYGILLGCNTV